jgi:hypothetical protein
LAEGRHASAPARHLPPAAWIVPVVLVVVGVVGFVLFGRGGGSIFTPHDKIPSFTFAQRTIKAESVTAARAKPPESAKTAAANVTSTLQTLYTEGFLDPGNWRDGSYDEVWPVFTDDAEAAAQRDQSTLTVGSAGGDTFTKIAEPEGHVEVHVLLNKQDQVATAVALVTFEATGTRKDGKLTHFQSTGQYFLRHVGGGWRIYAFDVHRDDTVTSPPAGPSADASGTAS